MTPKESFALRWQDLVIMSRDKSKITSVKTFDKQVGRLTKDGIIIKEEGINAFDKKSYSMFRLYKFSDVFSNVKSISQRQNVDEKFKQKSVLIADRRYPNQKLMTLRNGKYVRPKGARGAQPSSIPVANKNSKSKKKKKEKVMEKETEKQMEEIMVNPKYKGLKVNCQIARSLSFGPADVVVEMIDGQHGVLKGDYFVEDFEVGDEKLKKYTLIEECLSQISKICLNDVELAKRDKEDAELLTTGAGWDLYFTWLPEEYRMKKKAE